MYAQPHYLMIFKLVNRLFIRIVLGFLLYLGGMGLFFYIYHIQLGYRYYIALNWHVSGFE